MSFHLYGLEFSLVISNPLDLILNPRSFKLLEFPLSPLQTFLLFDLSLDVVDFPFCFDVLLLV
jgi:hypothetical protein